MGRKPLAIPTLLLAVLALVAMPGSALAGHEQRPEISGPVSLDASLMESYEKYFSSSVWLMTKGYDPRLTGIKGQPLGKLFPPQDINVRGVAPRQAAARDLWSPTGVLPPSSVVTYWSRGTSAVPLSRRSRVLPSTPRTRSTLSLVSSTITFPASPHTTVSMAAPPGQAQAR